MIPGWARHSYSLELRKLLSYRVDFWVNFLGSLFVQVMVNYFLWSAIFTARGVDQIGGYSFSMLMLYYLLVPLVERLTMTDAWTNISSEIYEGTLTRYIIYPVPIVPYKYMAHLAKSTSGAIQMAGILLLAAFFFERPNGFNLSAFSILQFVVVVLLASYLFFILNICVEMVAFWADSVWSLMVMVKFAVSLMGGSYLPLSLFPSAIRSVFELLPFSYFVSFPISCLSGQVSLSEWWRGLLVMGIWSVLLTLTSKVVWARGSRNYAGVGQ